MNSRRLAICLLLAAAFGAAPVQAQTGQIESIEGSGSFLGIRGFQVPAIERSQPNLLADGGTIDTDEYTKIVINIAGRVAGETGMTRGAVGAVLVPDIEPFVSAFRTQALLPASIEISAQADASNGTFMAKQLTFDVGFPRYRVLFYNTTGRPATVNFFVFRHRQ